MNPSNLLYIGNEVLKTRSHALHNLQAFSWVELLIKVGFDESELRGKHGLQLVNTIAANVPASLGTTGGILHLHPLCQAHLRALMLFSYSSHRLSWHHGTPSRIQKSSEL